MYSELTEWQKVVKGGSFGFALGPFEAPKVGRFLAPLCVCVCVFGGRGEGGGEGEVRARRGGRVSKWCVYVTVRYVRDDARGGIRRCMRRGMRRGVHGECSCSSAYSPLMMRARYYF